jgi:hypothetical protein
VTGRHGINRSSLSINIYGYTKIFVGLTIDGKMIHQLAVQYSEFDIKIIGWGYEFWRYVEISSFA